MVMDEVHPRISSGRWRVYKTRLPSDPRHPPESLSGGRPFSLRFTSSSPSSFLRAPPLQQRLCF